MPEIVNTIICKNCGSPAVVKFGTYKGVQRFWCKSCQRKFKADNALFHMKVSPEYISTALSGKTPAEAAKVDYQIKNWKELSQIPVSKEIEIQSHRRITGNKFPRITPPMPKISEIVRKLQ